MYRFILALLFVGILILAGVNKNVTLNQHQLDVPIGERN